ncbi:MAG: mechanosensitive ion channel family protein [Deltaproteobacteria bacterium]|nr:mechanosensitive ion channel family protein [Deltaproteobacteria bacterium]
MDISILGRIMIPLAITTGVTALLLVLRAVVFKFLHRWAKKTETTTDDIIIKTLNTPSFYWCVAIGLYIGMAISDLPEKYTHYLSIAIYILVISSMTIAAANLSNRLFNNYVEKMNLPIPATGLAQSMLKGTIIVVGLLMALGVIGVSIAPLITALGVGGLAVALALQDTLSNLFAGVHILVEKSIRVGDFVKLETGQEGYVDDITWRTTRIRMLPNNMVIVPNNKLAQTIVINYYLPEKRMSLSIPVSVGYSSDPGFVEKVLLDEAARAVGAVSGLLPEPCVRFIPGFGKDALEFTLVLQISEFAEQFSVQHELRKRIFNRFRKEGIEIPFPQRIVHLISEKGGN